MIYIIHDDCDASTKLVLRELKNRGIKHRSVKGEDLINPIRMLEFQSGHVNVSFLNNKWLTDASVFWFRRGFFQINYQNADLSSYPLDQQQQIKTHLQNESNTLLSYFLHTIQDKSIGNQLNYNQNKLIALKHAIGAGFNIPTSIVCKGHELSAKTNANKYGLITKNIQDILVLRTRNNVYANETKEVNTLEVYDDYGYSFLQERINVKYEFRVFVFLNDIFSIACVSNNGDIVDIRNRPNNTYTKCNLPSDITVKIFELMKRLGLKTASLDLLLDHLDVWWFLEINPAGQFGMMQTYGHYDIYERIVDNLIKFK